MRNDIWNFLVLIGIFVGSTFCMFLSVYWIWLYYTLFVVLIMMNAPSNNYKFAQTKKGVKKNG
jgi:hypothetical protein